MMHRAARFHDDQRHIAVLEPALELTACEPGAAHHFPLRIGNASSKTLFATSTATVVAFMSDSSRLIR